MSFELTDARNSREKVEEGKLTVQSRNPQLLE